MRRKAAELGHRMAIHEDLDCHANESSIGKRLLCDVDGQGTWSIATHRHAEPHPGDVARGCAGHWPVAVLRDGPRAVVEVGIGPVRGKGWIVAEVIAHRGDRLRLLRLTDESSQTCPKRRE